MDNNETPSEKQISSAWEFYRDAAARLHSRVQAYSVTQALLAVAFVALLLFEGNQQTETVIFVITLLVAALAIYQSEIVRRKMDSAISRMRFLRQSYLDKWDVYRQWMHGEAAHEHDDPQPSEATALLPDGFMMFWAAAVVASVFLFANTMSALQGVAAAH